MRIRYFILLIAFFVLLASGPAFAHACGHPASLTRIGTSNEYYKNPWFADEGTTHWAAIYFCGSSGCSFSYYHGHTPYTVCHSYWFEGGKL